MFQKPVSKMSFFFSNLGNTQSPRKWDCVSESYHHQDPIVLN